MDEIVKEFLIESNDHLDRMDNDFVAIEQNPSDQKLLASIFRAIHTIKGGAGMLGFPKLEKLTHTAESLLALLRDGKLALTTAMTNALLQTVDAVRTMLACIEERANDGELQHPELIAELSRLQSADPPAAPTVEASAPQKKARSKKVTEPKPAQQLPAGLAPVIAAETLESKSAVEENDAASAKPENKADKEHGTSLMTDSAIRVDVSLLDRLMNLAGELVLARNHVLQFAEKLEDSDFLSSIQRINQITTELREGVMKTRMQPIGNIWTKFPRIVRDLAKACGKQISLVMEGEKTELDKSLIEAIRDPLTHLLRNSVDHGVEPPEARVAKGKQAEGRITLRAYHAGGQVNIEICDDGGGINPEKIFKKAVEKGLVQQAQKEKMDEREMLNLIFQPGFSTAETVTNVSGRGVGMDVVKTNIEKIGGTVDIMTTVDRGTTFKLKIPLTLAIIPALIIRCGNNRYAIPQLNVVELVKLNGDSLHGAVEMFQDVPVYRLRGKLLPIVHLHHVLGKSEQINAQQINREGLNMVVLQVDERPFGLAVDEVIDTQEIVVKPLSRQLKGIGIYAGATMMGDEKIALILDVLNVAQSSKVIGKMRDRKMGERDDHAASHAQNMESKLLVRSPDDGRILIPLSQVARLEEFLQSSVEWVGGQSAIQYRGEIIPLIYLSHVLPERREIPRYDDAQGHDGRSDRIQAVVYSKGGRTVAIAVDKVLDIVVESNALQKTGARAGIVGTMVIQNRVAEVLDIEGVIRMALPDFYEYDAFASTDFDINRAA